MTTTQKLSEGRLSDPVAGWVVTIAITLMAFGLRFWNFWIPNKLMFDETYYPKDAWSLLKFGYERGWPKDINDTIVAGTPDVMDNGPGFVVHPPLGKWMIAIGEHLFGMNSFGWRFMAVVFGSLLVFFTIRLARRVSRSTLVGAIAGVLLTFDGLAFAMSRIGLLDIFQAVFTLAAVCCVVADRDWLRLRLARWLDGKGLDDLDGAYGPVFWWRPWRVAAGVMFGCAIACKWGSLYVLAVFGLLTVVWDIGTRRLAGASWSSAKALLIDGPIAFFYMVVLGAGVYLATWTGWLTTSGGWDRDWGAKNPDDALVQAIGAPLASLWHYHVAMWNWHTGDAIKAATHPYASHPGTWLFMIRPVGIDAVNNIPDGTGGCVSPGGTCLQIVTAMGTPIAWWLAALAVCVGLFSWVSGRDRRFVVPVLGLASVWLPWFAYADRPIFFFYAVVFVPFTMTALAMVLGKILGPAMGERRKRGAVIVGTVVGLVIINFAFIWPILTDELVPHSHWLYRMWFGTWI